MPTIVQLGSNEDGENRKLNEDEDDDDLDETLLERLVGLSEMFPNSVRYGSTALVSSSWQLAKWLYSTSCTGLWVVASSASLLALPAILEKEMIDMSHMEVQQQREMLFGPNVASKGASMAPGMMPTPALTAVPFS